MLVGVNDARCYNCGRAKPGLWGFGPALRQLGTDFGFVPFVIGASSVLYVLSLIVSGSELLVAEGFSILSPGIRALVLFGASGAVPVFGFGSWWTVLSATWLHGSLLHILLNMYWVNQLVPPTSEVVGPARTVVIYTVAGACGFLLSSLMWYLGSPLPFLRGAPYVVGASASVFGLLGALVHYGRMSGSGLIRGQATYYAVMMFVMGLLFPGVDNLAHAGGFAGGYAASMFFNPLTQERGDHTVMAALCVAGTLLAIVASIIVGLPLYR